MSSPISAVDPIAIVIDEITSSQELLALYGDQGADHVSGLNEPPYPHVQVTASPGGEDGDLLWTLVGEANILVWGDVDGRPGSAALRKLLYDTVYHVVRAQDRDQAPGKPVIVRARAIGSARWEPSPVTGQPCWAHTVEITAHPPHGPA